MIRAVLKRALVDLWDNAVAIFALNVLVLCALALGLYLVALTARLSPALLVIALLAAAGAGLFVIGFMAGLVEQVAARADLDWRAAMPSPLFCVLAATTLSGVAGVSGLLLVADPTDPAMAIATTLTGSWLVVFVCQALVGFPALALDGDGSPPVNLARLLALPLRFPLVTLVLALLPLPLMAATVGLLPGPGGIAYLMLRAGRLMRARFDPFDPAASPSPAAWADRLAAETRPLRTRTPRNLLQPWHTTR